MKYLRTCQQCKIPYEVGNDKDIILDKGSTADSGVETLWPTDTSGTVRSPVSPNILDLAVNRYGFDNPILTEENGGEVDVGNNGDDHSDAFVDNEELENVEPLKSTTEQTMESQPPAAQLRCSGFRFERFENVSQSVIGSLSE